MTSSTVPMDYAVTHPDRNGHGGPRRIDHSLYRGCAAPDEAARTRTASTSGTCAITPAGNAQSPIPTTKIEIGKVASAWLGASMFPTIAPVVWTTLEFAPASACATVSLETLPRA